MARDGYDNARTQPTVLERTHALPMHRLAHRYLLLLLAAAIGCMAVTAQRPAMAQQQPPHHYFQRADMAPGSIGQAQLMRGGPLRGHYQAVEVTGPEGVQLALANGGLFEPPQPAPLKAGLLVGNVYRLKITNIPYREGQELFPSIEIINRLYPPAGSEAQFPIPIQITREEMEMALRGQFVIRVIYLENPRSALPRVEDPERQRYFDVGPRQDPLEVADTLGRPMAIIRIGSARPDLDAVSGRFLFNSPPWIRFPQVVENPVIESGEAEPAPQTDGNDTTASVPSATQHRTAQRPQSGTVREHRSSAPSARIFVGAR